MITYICCTQNMNISSIIYLKRYVGDNGRTIYILYCSISVLKKKINKSIGKRIFSFKGIFTEMIINNIVPIQKCIYNIL